MLARNHFKPLFNARLLSEALEAAHIECGLAQTEIAQRWANSASSGALGSVKEKQLQGQFLTEVFGGLLGYAQIVSADDIHHLEPETSSKAVKGYRPPDARLGWYGAGIDRTRAVVELKSPGADLDAKQGVAYGRLTPVEQAFGYSAKVDGCRWVIVSNYLELRLYRTDRGQGYYQRFSIADLADSARLRAFCFLLGQATLLGLQPDSESAVERLATQTHVEEEQITKAFYAFYRDLRLTLFDQLRVDNPAPTGVAQDQHLERLLEHAQKILDRCLFICFCEDTRLLPAKVLTQALNAKSEGFVQVSRWQQLCGLFQAVDKGHPPMQINAYNGGLFAHDPELEALSVSTASLDRIAALAGYDFETDLNVNILGHIFEQSITDLELIRTSIRDEPDQTRADPQRSRRKRDGIFYTPELITRFMVERTIGGWLKERWAELEAKHRTGKPGPMANETRLKLLLDYLEVLKHIKILDPACGSGAFLVAAFDFLLAEYERVNAEIAALTGSPQQLGLFDLTRQILQQNLFGVDLNPESVEITKLSLWLKTAQRDKPLNNLDANIRCGNSLVEPLGEDAPEVLREAFAQLPEDSRAFDWQAAFPEVFARGGFDVVIGNPPYVRQEALGPLKLYLAQCYASYSGVADLYVYFYERGLNLLAPNGKLSYIVTNKWMRAGYGEPLRRLFSEQARLEEILDFGHAPIFEDADTFPCIIVAQRRVDAATVTATAAAAAPATATAAGATATVARVTAARATGAAPAGAAAAATLAPTDKAEATPMVSVCIVP
ncbi:MAG: Eco57I restriction-modification methylase domain-containing protein [Chromatiaceae bacterium]|nr:Eco57I restriction-modification methylase domain-containing protein [Chromatiaceae bacterium]